VLVPNEVQKPGIVKVFFHVDKTWVIVAIIVDNKIPKVDPAHPFGALNGVPAILDCRMIVMLRRVLVKKILQIRKVSNTVCRSKAIAHDQVTPQQEYHL
jgi:hypothetical protein